jgi:hypothetical protein
MLVSGSIPNFVNGVSQQPFTLRLSSQAAQQENGLSTAAQGLKKRPPSVHLNRQPINGADIYLHTINRDVTERYVLCIEDGDLTVFSLNGEKHAVNFPDGKAYLETVAGSPVATQFAAVSVADYTFIINKNVQVEEGSAISGTRPHEALVNLKQGIFGKTYSLTVGPYTGTFTTPKGTGENDAASINTNYILGQLELDLIAKGLTLANGWTVLRVGSTMYISRAISFTMTSEDGFNGGAMVVIKDKLARFSDLPGVSPVDGFTIEISGDNTASSDDYHVQFVKTPGTNSGVWKERPAPGIVSGLDASTMPFLLIREANGSFTFKAAEWGGRVAGSHKTNPNPSFVGRTLNEVFFYRNRLGFLSDENVIFTEAGMFFNVFRTSVISLLDSDPIDVASTHTKVSILRHALQFNKQLLLFSEQSQFVIDESDTLTPKTVAIKLTTEFPCNVQARPVGIGKNVYFAVNKGKWSAVREYYVDTNNLQNDATDITAHVPQYMPANIYKITASANEDLIACVSHDDPLGIYIYKYYFSGSEKLQASWSRWSFGSTGQILGIDILESDLFVFILRDGEMHFEKIDLSSTALWDNEPYLVHLDRKVLIPRMDITFDGTHSTILWETIGYRLDPLGKYAAVVASSNPSTKPGLSFDVPIDALGNIKVKGDITGNELIFGHRYSFSYILSPITVRVQQGQGQKADTEGRLQLRKLAVNYAETGYFEVNVTPKGRQTFNYKFTGKVLGVSSLIGGISTPTGKLSVPVLSQNIGTTIELASDSPLPCSFLSADWEGFYVKRSTPV